MGPKILLLQARHADDPARTEEVRSFARAAGLPVESFVAHDLLESPPTVAEIRRHDALMVGGSGEFYVSKRDLPHQDRLLDVLREAVETGPPTFASCFGFHLFVEALGGELIHDVENIQTGTYELSLTEEGREDELFGYLPDRFPAQLGRKDRAAELPPGVVHLASSELAPYQAFRIPGKAFWTTQFHPELDAETNKSRFLRYIDGYGAHMTPEEIEVALDRYQPSREADELLKRFLKLVLG